MITKATMWDKNVELTKGISCDWHEERGQMCMTVRTIDGEQDIAHWSHKKLTDALGSGYIKWGNADTIMEWYETHDILVEMPCIHKHQIIVGGKTVISTYLFYMAESTFEHYVEDQQTSVWMYNGDVYKEYNPMGFAGKLASMLNDLPFGEEPTIMVTVTLRDGSKIVATPYIAMIADVTYPHITILADEVPAKEDKDA